VVIDSLVLMCVASVRTPPDSEGAGKLPRLLLREDTKDQVEAICGDPA
jgi:hypothetical protein